MVVISEVLGELPARELVGADHAVHDPGLLEHDEVAVRGALRELGAEVADRGDGERAGRVRERLHECLPARCEALADVAQSRRRGLEHLTHGRRVYV
ncbi:MAG: hypothetical protein U0W40_12065 [Acidimicrobiia bacterium]